jgi:uncharacterized protein YybS (DUF2232 family)
MLVYPCPALLFSYERGARRALSSGLVVSMILLLLLPPFYPAMYFFTFWVSGTLIGAIARRVEGHGDLLLAGVVVSLACKVAVAMASARLTGINILMPDAAEMERVLIALGGSGLYSLPGGGAFSHVEDIRDTVNFMIMLMPFSMLIFSSIEVLVCCFLSSRIHMRRGGEPFFSLPPFGSWSLPRNILIALVVGFICDRVSAGRPDLYMVRQVGANLSAASRTLFIIQGLAVAYHFMENAGLPRFLRIILVLFAPLLSPMGDVCAIVGIVDIGFDLRKRMRRKPQ